MLLSDVPYMMLQLESRCSKKQRHLMICLASSTQHDVYSCHPRIQSIHRLKIPLNQDLDPLREGAPFTIPWAASPTNLIHTPPNSPLHLYLNNRHSCHSSSQSLTLSSSSTFNQPLKLLFLESIPTPTNLQHTGINQKKNSRCPATVITSAYVHTSLHPLNSPSLNY